MSFSVRQGDAIQWLDSLPPKSVDLVFFSPPYEDARTYGLPALPKGQAWVDWMVEVVQASLRACRGLVACVVEGRTRKFRYSATPFLLAADLHRKGVCLRKPCVFERDGVPGSGGPDWLKNRWEPIICATNGGKLPYFNLAAIGHAPKYAPGGACSNRKRSGSRAGYTDEQWAAIDHLRSLGHSQREAVRMLALPMQVSTSSQHADGRLCTQRTFVPPKLANPGNVISCLAGRGHMGDAAAHDNEAPFPEKLAAFFVTAFCPPGGVVADPFCGSGTTLAVAVKHGRDAIGCDIRESQVAVATKRCNRVAINQAVSTV